jgi:hypothetical protein
MSFLPTGAPVVVCQDPRVVCQGWVVGQDRLVGQGWVVCEGWMVGQDRVVGHHPLVLCVGSRSPKNACMEYA